MRISIRKELLKLQSHSISESAGRTIGRWDHGGTAVPDAGAAAAATLAVQEHAAQVWLSPYTESHTLDQFAFTLFILRDLSSITLPLPVWISDSSLVTQHPRQHSAC